MKKIILIPVAMALVLIAGNVSAQDKTGAATTDAPVVRSAENVQKEADALKKRVVEYTEKVEANRSNPKMDYATELDRIAEMKSKWEKLTGETWKEEAKK